MTGETIAHYRVLEKLGEGGMGVVYKAEDLKLKRTVALKFLSKKAVAEPAARARLLREAQAAGCLDHPNICQVYDLVESGENLFIVMACVDGPSLVQRLSEGLTLDRALDIAIQIAEGLQAAHARGIVHRDVKPANVLIGADGRARLTDFGLARIQQRSRITKPGTFMGTVCSMAPEQIRAEDADARTDIWAFGVMLYQICTGIQPFQGPDYRKSIRAILHEEPPRPTAVNPNLPPDLDRILAKALAKDRGERYQHIDELAADLRSVRRSLSDEQKSMMSGRAGGPNDSTVTAQQSWFGRLFRNR